MAVRDVREYYWQLKAQYEEMERDLADFTEALQNGFITEDRLTEVKDEVEKMKINCDRVAFILYLLEKPNRDIKKAKYDKRNKKLLNELDRRNATDENVFAENKSALDHIRAELKKLKENK
jgi:hypothetical protein